MCIRDSGKLIFDGKTDLTKRQEHDLVRLGIGRKFQTPTIFGSLTVYQNLEVAIGYRSRVTALFRRIKSDAVDRIHATLEQVGLSGRAQVQAGSLSHGEAVAGN